MPSPDALASRFDVGLVARLALREKQVQQSYRPIIQIHKWFARRPGSVFRSLLLSEFGDAGKETAQPRLDGLSESWLSDAYWRKHDLDVTVVDPFMGGGTTVYEALRLGARVIASDINPMAYWLVKQGVAELDLAEFEDTARALWDDLQRHLGHLYLTTCQGCERHVPAKYFIWVKTAHCPACDEQVRLLPGSRIAEAIRHTHEVLHCWACDTIHEVEKGERTCPGCSRDLSAGTVTRGKATCPHCQHAFKARDAVSAPPAHDLIAIEYHCADCYPKKRGRQFKAPDGRDHEIFEEARDRSTATDQSPFLPDEAIPAGDETTRLHRWGYERWRELFNERQRVTLVALAERIAALADGPVRDACSTVFSDFLRYQNMVCRYDTYALKCQDVFAVHGFPVALYQCENNVPGIPGVGSGSWIHFVEKFLAAKRYAEAPFEIDYSTGRKRVHPINGERITAPLERAALDGGRWAALSCGPSQKLELEPGSIDGVFTDPPYFDNVQYAELMDFCHVWLRRLVRDEAFTAETTKTDDELTGNGTLGRGLEHFTAGMSEVMTACSSALKSGAPFVFTYHHNRPEAYTPLVVAMLDAGLTPTAVLPVPAEMSASLHIAKTGSSVLDSVFVARTDVPTDVGPWPDPDDATEADRELLVQSGYTPTEGDMACLRAGHAAAGAVHLLRSGWDANETTSGKMAAVEQALVTGEPFASVRTAG